MSIYVDIKKQFGSFSLDVSFEAENETLALLGASGCGKSMTLKCIAGIEKPDEGKIVLDDKILFDSEKKINLAPQKRKAGLLFQNYALFPNMTVRQNIAAGIKYEKNKALKNSKINEYLERFGLTDLTDHLPSQLSGGQQQRTALARALIAQPDILLLDEPFSALDSHLRFNLEQEVKEVIKEFGKSVILVSHDKGEVFRLSEKIAVMKGGKIDCFGYRDEIFENPSTKTSALLTGYKNFSAMEKIDESHVLAKDWGIKLKTAKDPSGYRYVSLRTQMIREAADGMEFNVSGALENPKNTTIMLKADGAQKEILFNIPKDIPVPEKIRLDIPEEAVMLLK